ncbi:MAG: Crp/Fnr family transcriptional regulator [Gallionella sp.]|nr:Crp/Fnr family transcriptional regulator [Gallionella sp.]
MFFKDIPLFADLSESDHDLLLQVAVRGTYPRHAILVREGDPGDRFYLLRKGMAKVYLEASNGREVILAILGPGDFFGEMAMIDQEPCSANVMALEESEFVSIGKAEFQKAINTSPKMAITLLKVLCRRLREADQQIESLALKDVQARVEQALRAIAEPEGDQLIIPALITHRDIAAMVGASREMVTRVFRVLEASGIIRVDGRRTTLTRAAHT